jgi:choline transport protein
MVSTALVNGSLGFIMLITFLYTMGSVESVLKAPSGFAFVSAFHNATGSNATTTGLASIILVLEVCSAISILATASRQTFAFARDNALPFSRVFAYVPRRSQIPIYSILITTLITALLSLINIGSTAAFNAVASLAIGSLFMTYLFAIGCFIGVRIRSEHLPRARFSLGRFGLPINAFALAYLSFAIIFTFFPTTHDVTPVSMNWSILVLGAVVIFAVVQYVIHGHRIYQAPVSRVQKLQ